MRIINQSRFDKLVTLINRKKIFYGGTYNKKTLHISPTILSDVTFKDKVMREEIFGPILPVIKFKKIDEVILKLKKWRNHFRFMFFRKIKKRGKYFRETFIWRRSTKRYINACCKLLASIWWSWCKWNWFVSRRKWV